ncbi:hypothetical protein [Coleofasciculus sp. G2-EDA-02]|uniref:hypothetical protein n=1 Tax=Coleofasciculus sp. G2-EDA-02 TaxID=3069529 RepID=UPI0032F56B0A
MDESANFVSLGVGSSPILYKELSVERLVSALQVAVSDEAMRFRAIALRQNKRYSRRMRQAYHFSRGNRDGVHRHFGNPL